MIDEVTPQSCLHVPTDGESFQTGCVEDGLQPSMSVVMFVPLNGSRERDDWDSRNW